MMNKEYVNVNDFHYKGYNIDGVGDGDSFCYCPCDIYGTPKLFYGDCHFSCGSEAFDHILNSFNCHEPYDHFDDDEVNYIIEDMWLSSCGRGRLFFGKYLVVDDGHLPTKEYVKDAIDWLNENPRNYAIAYNTNNGVEEINCMEFLNGDLEGENDKPIKMDVPKEIQDLYSEIISRREYANNKFPKNMTRAEYYSLIRQENKEHKSMKKLIRLTEQDLHRIVKESVKRVLNEEVDMGQVPAASERRQGRTVGPKEEAIRKEIRHLRHLIGEYEDEGKDITPLQKKIDALKRQCGY